MIENEHRSEIDQYKRDNLFCGFGIVGLVIWIILFFNFNQIIEANIVFSLPEIFYRYLESLKNPIEIKEVVRGYLVGVLIPIGDYMLFNCRKVINVFYLDDWASKVWIFILMTIIIVLGWYGTIASLSFFPSITWVFCVPLVLGSSISRNGVIPLAEQLSGINKRF